MARQLTKEAKQSIIDDKHLFMAVCELLDIKLTSLPMFINRNSKRLTNHDVVLKIASSLKKQPDEILEECENEINSVLG